jgi:hypothetical protein
MKSLFAWVETKLSRPEATAESEVSKPLSVEDLVVPDIYAVDHVDTVPNLKIIDLSSPDIDSTTGFDPYDTAILRNK